MEAPELRQLLLDLYESRKGAKEWLEYWLNPDSKELTEKYAAKLHYVFYSKTGKPRTKPKLTEGNRLLQDYMTMCYDHERVAWLLLMYAEEECEWLQTRWKRTSHQTSMRKNLTAARLYIDKTGLEELYGKRIQRLENAVNTLYPY